MKKEEEDRLIKDYEAIMSFFMKFKTNNPHF